MADWSDLVGMTLDEAIDRAEKYKHKIRVLRWNKSDGVATADYREDRVNVEVERHPTIVDGAWKVTKVRGIG